MCTPNAHGDSDRHIYFVCCRPGVQWCRVRLASPWSQLPVGAAVEARVLQLERRVAGLLCVGQSAAVGGLAVRGRVASARRARRAARPAERDADPAALPPRGVPAGHSQHRVPLRGLQRRRQDRQQRRPSQGR